MIFLNGWAAMLVLGAIHDRLDPRVPAFGYWTTVFLLFVLSLIPGLVVSLRRTGK